MSYLPDFWERQRACFCPFEMFIITIKPLWSSTPGDGGDCMTSTYSLPACSVVEKTSRLLPTRSTKSASFFCDSLLSKLQILLSFKTLRLYFRERPSMRASVCPVDSIIPSRVRFLSCFCAQIKLTKRERSFGFDVSFMQSDPVILSVVSEVIGLSENSIIIVPVFMSW